MLGCSPMLLHLLLFPTSPSLKLYQWLHLNKSVLGFDGKFLKCTRLGKMKSNLYAKSLLVWVENEFVVNVYILLLSIYVAAII